jgi:hypothetical protein
MFVQLTKLVRLGSSAAPGPCVLVQTSNIATVVGTSDENGSVIEFVGGGTLEVTECYVDMNRILSC